MRCADVRDLIHPFHDGELEVDKNVDVLKHFELCAPCRERSEAEKLLRVRVEEAGIEPLAEGTRQKMLAAAFERVEAEGVEAARSRFPVRWLAAAAAVLVATGLGVFAYADPLCMGGCPTMNAIENTYVASMGCQPEEIPRDEVDMVDPPRCKGLACAGGNWVETPGVAPRPVMTYRCRKSGKQLKFFRIPEGHTHLTALREHQDGRRYVQMELPGGARLVGWRDERGLSCAVAPPDQGLTPEALLVMATALRDAGT